jgi:hypothetical protein
MTSITRKYRNISLQSKVLCIIVPLVMVALAMFGISLSSSDSSRADDNGKLNIILVTSPPTHDPTLKKISKTSRPGDVGLSIIIVTSPPTHDHTLTKISTTLRPATPTESPIVTEERPCLFFVSKSHN